MSNCLIFTDSGGWTRWVGHEGEPHSPLQEWVMQRQRLREGGIKTDDFLKGSSLSTLNHVQLLGCTFITLIGLNENVMILTNSETAVDHKTWISLIY